MVTLRLQDPGFRFWAYHRVYVVFVLFSALGWGFLGFRVEGLGLKV